MKKLLNNILLVEDNVIIALDQKIQLEKRGYVVTHAITGEKAIEIAKNKDNIFDLILMDLDLGKGIDGTDTAREILKLKDIPVLFLSSHIEPEIVEKTEIITSYGYVVKNSGITVLDASIKMAFKLFEAHNSLLKHKLSEEKANKDLTKINKSLKIVNKDLSRLDRAIENTKDIVFITDKFGLITFINPQFTKIYGYTHEETLGKLNPRVLNAGIISDKEDISFWKNMQYQTNFNDVFLNKSRNGKPITVEASIDPIFNNNGEIIEFVQIHRDITDQLQVEKQLRESEKTFRGIFEQSTMGIYRTTPEGKILLANPAIIKMLGYNNFEEIRDWDLNGFDFEPVYERTEFIRTMEKENKITGREAVWIKRDGTKLFVRESAMTIRNEKGKVKYYQGMVENISEQKQIKRELVQVENESKNYLDAINSMDLGLFIVNEDYSVRYMNDTMIKWFGDKTNLICYKSVAGLTDPCPYCRLKEVINTGENVIYTPTTEDGRTFNIHGSLLKNADGTVSKLEIIQDITELTTAHKHVETLLKEKKGILKEIDKINEQSSYNEDTLQIMQRIFDNFEEALWAVDKNFNFIFINSYFAKDFKKGLNLEIKQGMHAFSNIPPEYKKIWKPKYKEALRGNRISFEFKEDVFREIKYFRVNLNPIHTNNEITGVSAISVDITRQKLAEIKAQKEMNKSQQYLDISGVMFVAIDKDSKITLVNKKLCKTTGYLEEELLGKNWFTLMIPERFLAEIISVSKKLLAGKIEPVEYFENPILTKSGKEIIVAWHNNLLKDDNGNITGHLSSGEDITSRKKSEEEIKKLLKEKELILQEVHHRIKNNMTTLISLIALQTNTVKGKEAKNALLEIENRIRTMLVLYETLYQSSDFQHVSTKIYLSALIDDIIGNFPNSKSILVTKNISDFQINTKRIFNLGIVINELITNIMKYAFKDRSSGKIDFSALITNTNIVIIVADNGIGLPSNVDLDNNLGFGMRLIKMLVEQMEGDIQIERTNGTKFIISCNLK